MKFMDNEPREILLEEKFNVSNASRLLLSDVIDTEGKRSLQKYLKKLVGGKAEVKYTSNDVFRRG